jgi:hypothetical protein
VIRALSSVLLLLLLLLLVVVVGTDLITVSWLLLVGVLL